MKAVSLQNYRTDPYYLRIVRAVDEILQAGNVVAPIEVFVKMQLLDRDSLQRWRMGQVAYLERVLKCNLGKSSRILRILRMHAHDLKLRPSLTVYSRWGKGPKQSLRFSKTGDKNIELAYATHLLAAARKNPEPPTELPAAQNVENSAVSQMHEVAGESEPTS